jgi:large subunit ribosomal protein L9
MKVLLTADVSKLGWLGDVVEVADGYARNFLFPQGLAEVATDANVKSIAKVRAQRAEQRRLERQQLEKVAGAVNGAEVVIAASANELGHLFGSVAKHDIAENLRAQGFEVADTAVAIDEHIKQVGTYSVNLQFAEDLKVAVSVVVVPEGADVEAFKAAQKETVRQAHHEEAAKKSAKGETSPGGGLDEQNVQPAEGRNEKVVRQTHHEEAQQQTDD